MLLDADYTARLADFGHASLIGNVPEVSTYLLEWSTAQPGTLRWVAPEQIVLEGTSTPTIKSDIYSLGCVCLEGRQFNTGVEPILILLQVLSGKQPWSEVQVDAAVILHLVKGNKPGRPESLMDDLHWNLIQNCWSSMKERPVTEEIISTVKHFMGSCPQS